MIDPLDDEIPMASRRNRAGSRLMMDGNENLLENETSQADDFMTS